MGLKCGDITRNHHHHHCALNLKQVITFVIPLSPLLSVYKSLIPVMDLGFFLISLLFVLFLPFKSRIFVNKKNRVWLYYFAYIAFISLIAFITTKVLSGRLIKQLIYVIYILYFFCSDVGFDYEKAIVWYKRGVKVSAIYIFLQYIAFFFFSYGLPGYIPSLIYTESYAGRITHITASAFFRPTSLTYEATQYAGFVIIAVILYLFQSKNKIDIYWGVFISISIFLSSSSLGIACVMGIWLFWIYKYFLVPNPNKILYAIIFCFVFILILSMFFRSNIGTKILSRTIGEGEGLGGNAMVGRFDGYMLISDLSMFKIIFGSGYGILDERVRFYPSWAFNILCTGIIGTYIVLILMISYYRYASDLATKLIVLLLFFKSFVGLEFFTGSMLFYFMFIIPQIPAKHKINIQSICSKESS